MRKIVVSSIATTVELTCYVEYRKRHIAMMIHEDWLMCCSSLD